jgi:hypothetical protein
MSMSGAIWLAATAGIVSVSAIVRAFRTKTRARSLDLGSVSDQWVAAHRVGSGTGADRLSRHSA